MKLITRDFLKHCWERLRFAETEWASEQEFRDWAATQCEVDATAFNTFLTKLDASKPWGSRNARIVNVMAYDDWNLVEADAIPFKEESL